MNLLNKFETVKIDISSKISESDMVYLEELQKEFDAFLKYIRKLQNFLNENALDNTIYRSLIMFNETEKLLKEKTKDFINKVVWYFRKTYKVTLDEEKPKEKFDHTVTWQTLVKEIIAQLGGFDFNEKAAAEIKENLRKEIGRSDKLEIKGQRLIINWFLSLEESYTRGELKINYQYRERLRNLFLAITHFENGSSELPIDFNHHLLTGNSMPREKMLGEHVITGFNTLKSIRLFLNRKVELKFTSSDACEKFAREYCGRVVTPEPGPPPIKEQVNIPKLKFQQVVEDILKAHGQLDAFYRSSFYMKLEIPGYMDLVIEREGSQVCVGHYHKENGDTISDPVLVFMQQKGSDAWLLWRIELVLGDTEIIKFDEDNQPSIIEGQYANFLEFSEMFATNLVVQGWERAKIKEAA